MSLANLTYISQTTSNRERSKFARDFRTFNKCEFGVELSQANWTEIIETNVGTDLDHQLQGQLSSLMWDYDHDTLPTSLKPHFKRVNLVHNYSTMSTTGLETMSRTGLETMLKVSLTVGLEVGQSGRHHAKPHTIHLRLPPGTSVL